MRAHRRAKKWKIQTEKSDFSLYLNTDKVAYIILTTEAAGDGEINGRFS